MKISPLYHALVQENLVHQFIIHTNQHYDLNTSDALFHDLERQQPHYHLGIGSGTHAEQKGQMMMAYKKLLVEL